MPHSGIQRELGDLKFNESRLSVKSQLAVGPRLTLLISLWHKLCDAIPRESGFSPIDAHLSGETLLNVVIQYFIRLDHYKLRHNIGVAEPAKRAALTAMWIAHLRPINLRDMADDDLKENYLLINEEYAIFVSISLLEISFDELTPDHHNHILYLLRYGDVCEDSFIFAFEALMGCVNEKRSGKVKKREYEEACAAWGEERQRLNELVAAAQSQGFIS